MCRKCQVPEMGTHGLFLLAKIGLNQLGSAGYREWVPIDTFKIKGIQNGPPMPMRPQSNVGPEHQGPKWAQWACTHCRLRQAWHPYTGVRTKGFAEPVPGLCSEGSLSLSFCPPCYHVRIPSPPSSQCARGAMYQIWALMGTSCWPRRI